MKLLEGKKGIIMGVANEYSIATGVAQEFFKQGAQLGFSHLPDQDEKGRMKRRVERALSDVKADLVEPCDVGRDEDIENFFGKVREQFGTIDFLIHSIAFAPLEDIRGATLDASRAGFLQAMDISVYSFIKTTEAAAKLMERGGSVVTMSYFGAEKIVAGYNMMGVCKAALESAVKYLAYDLGPKNIRVNALSAGPIKTLASSAISDLGGMLKANAQIAPMQRNATKEEVASSTVYLVSDLSTGVTAETLHVDGGYHAMGSPGRLGPAQ